MRQLNPGRQLVHRWRREGYAAAVAAGEMTPWRGGKAGRREWLATEHPAAGHVQRYRAVARRALDLAQAGAVIAQGIARGVATAIDLGRVVPAWAGRDAPRPV